MKEFFERAASEDYAEDFVKWARANGYRWKPGLGFSSDIIKVIAGYVSSVKYYLNVDSIIFEYVEDVPNTDGRKKVFLNLDLLEQDAPDAFLGNVLHELAHVKYDSPKASKDWDWVFRDSYPFSEFFVHNIFEDIRIETILAKDHPASKVFMEKFNLNVFSKGQAKVDNPVLRLLAKAQSLPGKISTELVPLLVLVRHAGFPSLGSPGVQKYKKFRENQITCLAADHIYEGLKGFSLATFRDSLVFAQEIKKLLAEFLETLEKPEDSYEDGQGQNSPGESGEDGKKEPAEDGEPNKENSEEGSGEDVGSSEDSKEGEEKEIPDKPSTDKKSLLEEIKSSMARQKRKQQKKDKKAGENIQNFKYVTSKSKGVLEGSEEVDIFVVDMTKIHR